MLRAFLVAPIGAASVYAALLLIDPFKGQGAFIAAIVIIAAVVTASYVAEATIAWPAFLLLRRIGLANSVVSVIGGVTLGVLLAAIFDLSDFNIVRWHYYAPAGLAGAFSGAMFSYMMFWRPNKQLQPSSGARAES